MTQRRRKANKISDKKRLQIAKWREKNPTASYKFLADKFNVTYEQARTACKKFKDGDLGAPKLRRTNKINAKIEAFAKDGDYKALIKDMFNEALVKVSEQEDLVPEQLLKITQELIKTQRQLLAIDLYTQIKSPDVDKVCKLVRLVDPTLTDAKIIELWHTVTELIK
jgi:hypothetical protein